MENWIDELYRHGAELMSYFDLNMTVINLSRTNWLPTYESAPACRVQRTIVFSYVQHS